MIEQGRRDMYIFEVSLLYKRAGSVSWPSQAPNKLLYQSCVCMAECWYMPRFHRPKIGSWRIQYPWRFPKGYILTRKPSKPLFSPEKLASGSIARYRRKFVATSRRIARDENQLYSVPNVGRSCWASSIVRSCSDNNINQLMSSTATILPDVIPFSHSYLELYRIMPASFDLYRRYPLAHAAIGSLKVYIRSAYD